MQVERTRMYRVRDVAGLFEVSVATVYRAIEAGQLAALKLGTGKGTLRVSGAAVLAYAEACTQPAGAAVGTTAGANADADAGQGRQADQPVGVGR